MIAGALAGAALAAWVAAVVAGRVRTVQVRRRLAGAAVAGPVGGRGVRAAARVAGGHGGDRAPVGAADVPGGRNRDGAPPAVARSRVRGGGRGRSGGTRTGPRAGGLGWRRPAVATGVEALVGSCDSIARSLRSGTSLSAAVAGAAAQHRHPALVEVARSIGLGVAVPAAIARAAHDHDDADTSLVLQVLAVGAEHGGAPAEAIDRAAATVREREALRAERRSQAASARLSARVMTVLPFGFTGFVAATDADVRRILLATPLGWTCLAVGVTLNLAGRAWTARAVAT